MGAAREEGGVAERETHSGVVAALHILTAVLGVWARSKVKMQTGLE